MSTIAPVRNRSDMAEFLRLPWKIYADYPAWVPPILSMQKRELDPEKGPFFRDGFGSRAEYFLARRGDEVVGRIAAIRNGRHLRQQGDDVGFFGFFESIDDPGVAHSLLEAAEGWIGNEGLAVSRGPTSFTLNDPFGVTIEGGDVRPSVQIGYTPAYYAALLEACGYGKVRDLFCYHASMENVDRVLERGGGAEVARESAELVTRPIDREHLERDAGIIADIINRAWRGNWGAFPMLPEDFLRLEKEMGPFFDERLGHIAFHRGKPVGIFLAAPDAWEIFQHLDGKLGPKGIWKVMRERKNIRRFRLFLMGMLPDLPSGDLARVFLRAILENRVHFPAMETLELSWILEENEPVIRMAEAFGGKRVHRLRIYEKFL